MERIFKENQEINLEKWFKYKKYQPVNIQEENASFI